MNVGGARPLSSPAFARALRAHDTVSIGAAGTFVARAPIDIARLRQDVERALPHPTEAVYLDVLRLREIARLTDREWAKPAENSRRFASFLCAPARRPPPLPVRLPAPAAPAIVLWRQLGDVVLSVRRTDGEPGAFYPNPIVERLFGVPATTRAWETVARAIAAAERTDA